MSYMATYKTEDGATVNTGDKVYDYYSMEPVIIGEDLKDGWFDALRADGSGRFASATMLNGQRICTMAFAKRHGFPGA
jgi:hypothetical protein